MAQLQVELMMFAALPFTAKDQGVPSELTKNNPLSRIRTSDLWITDTTTVHRSTN